MELDVGRRQPAARAREGDDLGDRRAELARTGAAATRPAAWACRRRTASAGRRPPRAASRTGGPAGCARRRAARGAGSTPAARSSSAGPIPDSSSSCGEPIAPAERITSRSARTSAPTPLRPWRRRTPTARSPSSSTPSTCTPVRTSRFGRRQRRAQVGVGGAEALPVPLGHLEHRGAVLLGPVVVGDPRDPGGLAGGEQAPVRAAAASAAR